MKTLLSTLWSWLRPKLAKLFTITAKSIAKEVLTRLNDTELQQLAYQSVQAAAENGFKGNDAFDIALAGLTAKLKSSGITLAGNVKDTLIQNAYCVLKNSSPES